MGRRGRRKGTKKTGGRKRGTPNKITIRMGGTFAEAAKAFDSEALAVLVEYHGGRDSVAERARARCRARA